MLVTLVLTTAASLASSAYLYVIGSQRLELANQIDDALQRHDDITKSSKSSKSSSWTCDATGDNVVEVSTHHHHQQHLRRIEMDVHSALWEREFPFIGRLAFHLALLKIYSVPALARAFAQSHTPLNPFSIDMQTFSSTSSSSSSVPSSVTSIQQQQLHFTPPVASPIQQSVFVVAVLIVEPCRMVDKFGYRQLSMREKEASCALWRRLAQHVGVDGAPRTFQEAERFMDTMLDSVNNSNNSNNTTRTDSSPHTFQLILHNIDTFLASTLPHLLLHNPTLLHLFRSLVTSFLDTQTRRNLGLPEPNPWILWMSRVLMNVAMAWVSVASFPRRQEDAVRDAPLVVCARTVLGETVGITGSGLGGLLKQSAVGGAAVDWVLENDDGFQFASAANRTNTSYSKGQSIGLPPTVKMLPTSFIYSFDSFSMTPSFTSGVGLEYSQHYTTIHTQQHQRGRKRSKSSTKSNKKNVYSNSTSLGVA